MNIFVSDEDPVLAAKNLDDRRLLTRYAKLTGTPLDFVNWQGHDFSMRGMSGLEDAASSGAGHLLSFTGTDTISAIDYLEDYYCDQEKPYPFIGGSVPATEHSVMCMGGSDDEIGTFRRLISSLYPSGIISIVSDTWDFWEVITGFTVKLKEDILRRDGKVVFRLKWEADGPLARWTKSNRPEW